MYEYTFSETEKKDRGRSPWGEKPLFHILKPEGAANHPAENPASSNLPKEDIYTTHVRKKNEG